MVDIFYTRIDQEFPEHVFQYYLRQLPVSMQERNRRFLRWQDRHANLMGKILLIEAVSKFGLGPECLQQITYNSYGKPFLDGINFNISHSGEYVVCAITKDIRLGVDIEQMKRTSLDNFTSVMTDDQWKKIRGSEDVIKMFYTYWVVKESVIKAEDRGMSIPLEDIGIYEHTAELISENRLWHIRHLPIDTKYASALATNVMVSDQEVQLIPFQVLDNR